MGSSTGWVELRWEGRLHRCVGYLLCLPNLLTRTLEDLSSSDGFRYYISDRRTGNGLGMYDTVFVSSPNADWCPWLPSPDGLVFLPADGTFGWDDFITWPQQYHDDAPHLACIPRSSHCRNSLVHTFRRSLRKDHVTFTDKQDDGLRVAMLSNDFNRNLESGIVRFLEDIQEIFSTQKIPPPPAQLPSHVP